MFHDSGFILNARPAAAMLQNFIRAEGKEMKLHCQVCKELFCTKDIPPGDPLICESCDEKLQEDTQLAFPWWEKNGPPHD